MGKVKMGKVKKEKVKPIDTGEFTEDMMMEMRRALECYDYIQKHYKDDDGVFRAVYTDFYVLNASGQMKVKGNKDIYFKKLQEVEEDADLIKIVKGFYEDMNAKKDGRKDYLFSFSTKLLHTKNPAMPIYDSRVEQYLKEQEEVEFWNVNDEGKKVEREKIDRIQHNWEKLLAWSENSLKEDKWKAVIKWFDKEFPKYEHISPVKKIDTTIYVWVKSTT